jgi:hypothetical protein
MPEEMKAKKRNTFNGNCNVPECKEFALAHDLPLCREHWYSTPQEDRTWYVNAGSSVLHRIISGEMSVSDINEAQVRADKLYGEK